MSGTKKSTREYKQPIILKGWEIRYLTGVKQTECRYQHYRQNSVSPIPGPFQNQ
jgi:hypothetical protein